MSLRTEAGVSLTPEQELKRIAEKRALDRRRFIKGLGVAGAGAVAAGVLATNRDTNHASVMASGPSPTDPIDVLNLALNLEYLEASFYLYATTGSGLSAADMGSGAGVVMGGVQTTFTTPILQNLAMQIAADEKAHVELIRGALGSAAVPMPEINFGAIGMSTSQDMFVLLAISLEDSGTSTYTGLINYLSGTGFLPYAAQVLTTEANHAAALRYFYVANGLVGAPPLDAYDVPPSMQSFFDEKGGLAVSRTSSQALALAYGNATPGTNKGGLFPNGVNGNINTV